jgi:hypothetical protein
LCCRDQKRKGGWYRNLNGRELMDDLGIDGEYENELQKKYAWRV